MHVLGGLARRALSIRSLFPRTPSPVRLRSTYALPALLPTPTPQIPDSQKDVGSNHAVSALKFRILQNFMKLGYSVFLSGGIPGSGAGRHFVWAGARCSSCWGVRVRMDAWCISAVSTACRGERGKRTLPLPCSSPVTPKLLLLLRLLPWVVQT